jgi:excisionase family DNA binding protein
MKREEVALIDLLPQIYHHINVVVRAATREAMEQLLKGKSFKEPNMEEDFLSAEQAATFLKIRRNSIYKKVKNAELPVYRSGKRKLLFSKKELEQYVAKEK